MKKRIFYFILVAMIFVSCEKKEVVSIKKEKPVNVETLYAKTEYNLDMQNFAKAVDIAINSSEDFRKIIHKESKKRFLGANDVVISRIANEPVTQDTHNNGANRVQGNNDFLVSDLLDNALSIATNKPNTTQQQVGVKLAQRSPAKSLIKQLTEKYPKLQVSIPVHPDDLEDPNYIPPVAFISTEYAKGKSKYMVGYKNSVSYAVDGINEPKKAVIVVGLNERMSLTKPKNAVDDSYTPKNLKSTVGKDGIGLTWDIGDGWFISDFIIERNSSKTNKFIKIGMTSYNNRVFFDNNTETGVTYYYRISSYSSLIETTVGDYSNIVSAVGPPRPKQPLSFDVIQTTNKYVELNWSNDPTQNINSVDIYKHIVGVPKYDFFNSYSANTYNAFDTTIKAGQIIKYAIQNKSNTGKSNFLYDYIHVSERNPKETLPVRVKKIECKGRDFEPWGMGPPEFSITVFTGQKSESNNKTKTIKLCAKIIEFSGYDAWFGSWDRTQEFNVKLFDWIYNLYEKNYDVVTIQLAEHDFEGWEEFSFTGKIGRKFAIKNSIKPSANSPLQFDAGIFLEDALNIKYNFAKSEDLGYCDYFYYEPINKTLEFSYDSSTVYITLGK